MFAKQISASILLVLLFWFMYADADYSEQMSIRSALKVISNCSNYEDVFICLKKQAVVLLDELGLANQISLSENVKIVRLGNYSVSQGVITGEKLDDILPKSLDSRSTALNLILMEKFKNILEYSVLEITMPKEEKVNFQGKYYETYSFK